MFLFKNFVWSTLAAEALDTDTEFQLEDVSRIPSLSPGQTLVMALHDGVQDGEIVYASSFSGSVLTVERGQEDTISRVWPAGTKVFATFSAAMMDVVQDVAPADQITFTPAGTIASTSVQSAIEEVATDAAADDAALEAAYIAADAVVEAALQAQIDSLLSVDTGLQNQIDDLITHDLVLDGQVAGKQPLDALLTSIAGLATSADQLIYTSGVDVAALATLTSYARTLLDDLDAAAARSTLALGALSTLSTVGTSQIDDAAVTLAKQANVVTSRLMGRLTAGSGAPEALTGTQATTLLDAFTSALKGLAPASGGGTDNFLRADGSWAEPLTSAIGFTEIKTYLATSTANLTSTWTKPANLYCVLVLVIGGGGAGGVANSTGASTSSAGSGGGAGGFAVKRIAAASLGATETVTSGGKGAASGGNGGTSSFGAHVSAIGGNGGVGTGAVGSRQFASGGTGGNVSGHDYGVAGGRGSYGVADFFSTAGGASMSGWGGVSGLGVNGNDQMAMSVTGVAGDAGFQYGCGGGGARNGGSQGANSGGQGGAGVVIVYEFIRE